jgi:antitoxin component YwqK of YwqJK toxin-antitoxin module
MGKALQNSRLICFFLTVFSLLATLPDTGISAQEGGGGSSTGEKWYISNAGGMALEPSPSRLAALRNKYSLMVRRLGPGELPERLREHYRAPWDIEARILYTEGAESRRQWVFLEEGEFTRLAAVFVEPSPPEGEAPAEEAADGENVPPDEKAAEAEEDGEAETAKVPTGFIELYDRDGFITGERRFQDDGEEIAVEYFYKRQILIRAETTRKPPPNSGPPDSETGDLSGGEEAGELPPEAPEDSEAADPEAADPEPADPEASEAPPEDVSPVEAPPVERLVYTDYYRYSRWGSLRAIERVYHEPAAEADSPVRIRFPHRSLDSIREEGFVSPSLAYGSESFSDVFMDPVSRVVYNTDQRGRILSETRFDDKGEVVGELSNIWEENRLAQVVWKAGDEERRVEYRYNADGDRIEERNYRNGNLERLVMREGDIEVEELYMDGRPILRARWEKGRKISEERIRSGDAGGGQ